MRSMSAALWVACASVAAAQTPLDAQAPLEQSAPMGEPELELLGGPEGDPIGAPSSVALDPFAAPLSAPLGAALGAQPASAPALAPSSALARPAPGMNGPAGAIGVGMGVGYCWQAPDAHETRGALTLALCDGGQAQRVRLENGALLVGEDGARMVRVQGAPAIGAALIVDDVAAAAPDGPEFEYIRRGKLMRVVGTELCVAPSAGGAGEGAALVLDSCASPSAGDPTHLRATFVMSWR